MIIDSVRLRLWLLSNGLRFEAAISVLIGLMSANAVRINHKAALDFTTEEIQALISINMGHYGKMTI